MNSVRARFVSLIATNQTCPLLPDPNTLLGDNISFLQIPTVVTKWITWALVLHIVAFGLSAFAALFGLLAHVREMAMTCFSSCISGFAATVALVAFIFDLVLFFTARARINAVNGGSATLGSAIWLTLVAWVLLFFSGCFYGLGRCCASRRPRAPGSDKWSNGNTGGPAGNSSKDQYAEMMRLDAVKAEADRKARQAAGERGLPAFPAAEEHAPLASNYEAHYGEAEDFSSSPYKDHQGPGRVAGPRYPQRAPTQHSTAPSTDTAYGNAAYATGYIPGQRGTRTIDQYNAPGNPSYPPSSPVRVNLKQPSIPSRDQSQYDANPSYPGYGSPSPTHYRNEPSSTTQAPSHSNTAYATGAAAGVAGVGAYAMYKHNEQTAVEQEPSPYIHQPQQTSCKI